MTVLETVRLELIKITVVLVVGSKIIWLWYSSWIEESDNGCQTMMDIILSILL